MDGAGEAVVRKQVLWEALGVVVGEWSGQEQVGGVGVVHFLGRWVVQAGGHPGKVRSATVVDLGSKARLAGEVLEQEKVSKHYRPRSMRGHLYSYFCDLLEQQEQERGSHT